MNETILGKISSVEFGLSEGRFGLWLTLSGSSSVQTSYVCWDPETNIPGKYHKWNNDDLDKEMASIMRKISEMLNKAKVNNVNDLLNIPVEFTFKNSKLDSWRILEEVL